jgi:hypothetical protein
MAPRQSGHYPDRGSVIGSSFTLKFFLDKSGDCKWCTSDLGYTQCSNDCVGDGTKLITCGIKGLPEEQTVNVYVSCRDLDHNQDTALTNTDLYYVITSEADKWFFYPQEVGAWENFEIKEGEEVTKKTEEKPVPKVPEPEVAGVAKIMKDVVTPFTSTLGPMLSPILSPFEGIFHGAYRAMPEPVRQAVGVFLFLSLLVAMASALFVAFYAPSQADLIFKEGMLRFEEKRQAESLQQMKDRKEKLRKKLSEFEKKKIAGLNNKELIQKKAYQEELSMLENELLQKDEYLIEISKKVDSLVQEARKGAEPSQIKARLVKEGYTSKEINVMEKLFKKRMQQDN